LYKKCFAQLFVLQYIGFVIFWQKEISANAAHKMLVKLTTGAKNYKNLMMKKGSREFCFR